MSNKNIFHVKMPVFDAQYGWGKVVAIFDNLCLPVEVKFNKLRDTITDNLNFIYENEELNDVFIEMCSDRVDALNNQCNQYYNQMKHITIS